MDQDTADQHDVRAAAFRAFVSTGEAPIESVAQRAGLPAARTRRAARMLADAGFMVLDGDEIVGVAGLSRVVSVHQLQFGSRSWHTWCAYDGVGIPAALGVDALVYTHCPTCEVLLTVTIKAGVPSTGSSLTGWLPTTSGSDPLRQFCPRANLFCNPEHLDSWVRTAGNPPGQACSLEDLARYGVEHWGPMV